MCNIFRAGYIPQLEHKNVNLVLLKMEDQSWTFTTKTTYKYT